MLLIGSPQPSQQNPETEKGSSRKICGGTSYLMERMFVTCGRPTRLENSILAETLLVWTESNREKTKLKIVRFPAFYR